jgi:two-component system response regulator ChvI
MRVVIVDDDQLYLEALRNELEEKGLAVSTFSDGEALLQSFNAAVEVDIAAIDWTMPGMTGLELLSQLRKAGIKIPTVFLTERSLVEHEHAALQEGALDFIDKARGVDVLVHRLALAVRRNRDASRIVPPAMHLSDLVLRPNTARVEWRTRDVGLTNMEYRIIALLATTPGEYATYREIYDTMHYAGFLAGQGRMGVMTNVRSTIKRIRQKFLRIDPRFDEILNQSGVGYCWRPPSAAEPPSPTDAGTARAGRATALQHGASPSAAPTHQLDRVPLLPAREP